MIWGSGHAPLHSGAVWSGRGDGECAAELAGAFAHVEDAVTAVSVGRGRSNPVVFDGEGDLRLGGEGNRGLGCVGVTGDVRD